MNKPIHIPVRDFAEEFAVSIKSVDAAMKSISASGIKEETIVTLIKDQLNSRITKDQIRDVLRILKQLKTIYMKEQ